MTPPSPLELAVEALEKISGASFEGASKWAINGEWYLVTNAMLDIAASALAAIRQEGVTVYPVAEGAARSVEPINGEEQRDIAAFVDQGRKQQAARLAGERFTTWLLKLARIAEPEDPAAWLVGCAILNEECWFNSFSDGYSPAECWAEECSYD